MGCRATVIVFPLVLGTIVLSTGANAGIGSLPAKTIDLASGQLGGHTVIGRSVAGVTAALGRPDQRIPGLRRYTLRYERVSSPVGTWGMQILFRREHGVLRSWSLVVTDPSVSDPRIGKFLRLAPSALETAVMSNYGSRYKILRSYRCTSKPPQCRGELGPRGAGQFHIGFGFLPQSRRTYLVLYT